MLSLILTGLTGLLLITKCVAHLEVPSLNGVSAVPPYTTIGDHSELLSPSNLPVVKNDNAEHEGMVVKRPTPTALLSYAVAAEIAVSDLQEHTTMIRNAASLTGHDEFILQARDTVEANLVQLLARNEELVVAQEEDPSALYCSGANMNKKDIAGVCMDGNFILYSGYDCAGKCKCDGSGKISCDIPSDCGPQKDVVEYCTTSLSFSCNCLAKTLNVDKAQRDVDDPDEISQSSVSSMNLGMHARDDAEQDQDSGVPMISPCFYVESLGCDPFNPHRTTKTLVTQIATTLATTTK